jgi:hypothetical protein
MREVWGRYVEAKTPLRALTSEGQNITVQLTGFREDKSQYGSIYPILSTSISLHEKERVLLVWNTADDISLVGKRPYIPTREQTAFVSALAIVQYMPNRWQDRWNLDRFGHLGINSLSGVHMDPSESGNLETKYFSVGDEFDFFVSEVANRIEEEGSGRQYFDGLTTYLIAVGHRFGESRIVSVYPPYYFLRIRNAFLVASLYYADQEQGTSLDVIARKLENDNTFTPSPDTGKYVISGAYGVMGEDWSSSGSRSDFYDWNDSVFDWPSVESPNDTDEK